MGNLRPEESRMDSLFHAEDGGSGRNEENSFCSSPSSIPILLALPCSHSLYTIAFFCICSHPAARAQSTSAKQGRSH